MTRRLLNLLTLPSLLLCLGSAAGLVRTYFVMDWIAHEAVEVRAAVPELPSVRKLWSNCRLSRVR